MLPAAAASSGGGHRPPGGRKPPYCRAARLSPGAILPEEGANEAFTGTGTVSRPVTWPFRRTREWTPTPGRTAPQCQKYPFPRKGKVPDHTAFLRMKGKTP